MDLKTPYKAPWKNQMAFEAEMWRDFVTFTVKNHSEELYFLSVFRDWGVTKPGKCYSRQSSHSPLNPRTKRCPELFKHAQDPTDRLGHSQSMRNHNLGYK